MTENEKIELFDKWYDENYDEWAEGEEGIALREELEQAFKSGIATLEKENAELKKELVEKGQHLDLTEKEWGKDLVQMYHFKTLYIKQREQLTKAKELLKQFLEAKNGEDTYKAEWEAEQFLNEVEK